jgi:hypothetical protein
MRGLLKERQPIDLPTPKTNGEYIGKRVAKKFYGKPCFGMIAEYWEEGREPRW